MTDSLTSILVGSCPALCSPDCERAIVENPVTGRFFITMGHPGFNARANNGFGYATEGRAAAAIRGRRVPAERSSIFSGRRAHAGANR